VKQCLSQEGASDEPGQGQGHVQGAGSREAREALAASQGTFFYLKSKVRTTQNQNQNNATPVLFAVCFPAVRLIYHAVLAVLLTAGAAEWCWVVLNSDCKVQSSLLLSKIFASW
jgi:hypothetical protein